MSETETSKPKKKKKVHFIKNKLVINCLSNKNENNKQNSTEKLKSLSLKRSIKIKPIHTNLTSIKNMYNISHFKKSLKLIMEAEESLDDKTTHMTSNQSNQSPIKETYNANPSESNISKEIVYPKITNKNLVLNPFQKTAKKFFDTNLMNLVKKDYIRQKSCQKGEILNKFKDIEEPPKYKKTNTIKKVSHSLLKLNPLNVSSILRPFFDEYEGFHQAMKSSKTNGAVFAYGVNCYKGIYRDYNEDRVVIFNNIIKPKTYEGEWPNTLSIFSIFDGHGGKKCADYLRDHLHSYLIHNPNFPKNIEKAITESFNKLDEDYLKNETKTENNELKDNSGSCALVCIVVDDVCYIANTGDSRAIISRHYGKTLNRLSNDHKPDSVTESKRVKKYKGEIYQSSFNPDIYRISPGNLSVSRTFGDASSKLPEFGGKKNVIICTPDIIKISLKDEEENDYIFMGCDGIYDKLSNNEINQCIWETLNNKITLTKSLNSQCSLCVDLILKTAMKRGGTDNVSGILIAFKGLYEKFKQNTLEL